MFGYLRDIAAGLGDVRDRVVRIEERTADLPSIRKAVGELLEERMERRSRVRRRRAVWAVVCSIVAVGGTVAGIVAQIAR